MYLAIVLVMLISAPSSGSRKEYTFTIIFLYMKNFNAWFLLSETCFQFVDADTLLI
jgi:hypothetical protein